MWDINIEQSGNAVNNLYIIRAMKQYKFIFVHDQTQSNSISKKYVINIQPLLQYTCPKANASSTKKGA